MQCRKQFYLILHKFNLHHVDAPPVLLYSFIEQTLQPGPAVSLKCSATGNPTPEVNVFQYLISMKIKLRLALEH